MNNDISILEDDRNSSFYSASDASFLVISQRVKSLISRSRPNASIHRLNYDTSLGQTEENKENLLNQRSQIVCIDRRPNNGRSLMTSDTRMLPLESFGLEKVGHYEHRLTIEEEDENSFI